MRLSIYAYRLMKQSVVMPVENKYRDGVCDVCERKKTTNREVRAASSSCSVILETHEITKRKYDFLMEIYFS